MPERAAVSPQNGRQDGDSCHQQGEDRQHNIPAWEASGVTATGEMCGALMLLIGSVLIPAYHPLRVGSDQRHGAEGAWHESLRAVGLCSAAPGDRGSPGAAGAVLRGVGGTILAGSVRCTPQPD